MPVIVFAAQAGLEERLAVVQAGARMSLQKPIAPQEVVQAIAQVVQSVEPSMPSLLIVDDDPAMLVYLQSLLLPWGFQVTLLSEPQQFWTVLEQIQPDLLVLDIEMPDISGLDLCQIVRNDAQWGELPILMLSVYRNAETLTQVFNSGADDYINKPVTGPELIARIANRLRRSGRRSC
jgi:DNA-binding response OmpR family regulator